MGSQSIEHYCFAFSSQAPEISGPLLESNRFAFETAEGSKATALNHPKAHFLEHFLSYLNIGPADCSKIGLIGFDSSY